MSHRNDPCYTPSQPASGSTHGRYDARPSEQTRTFAPPSFAPPPMPPNPAQPNLQAAGPPPDRTLKTKKSFAKKVLGRVGANGCPSSAHDTAMVFEPPSPPADVWHTTPRARINQSHFTVDPRTGHSLDNPEIKFRSSSPYTRKLPGVALIELVAARGVEDGEALVADVERISEEVINIVYRWYDLKDFSIPVEVYGAAGYRLKESLGRYIALGFKDFIERRKNTQLPPGAIRLGRPGSRLAFENFRLVKITQIAPGYWLVDLAWVEMPPRAPQ